MSAHHRKPSATKVRTRSVVGGALMTGVFLAGSSGLAFATEGDSGPKNDEPKQCTVATPTSVAALKALLTSKVGAIDEFLAIDGNADATVSQIIAGAGLELPKEPCKPPQGHNCGCPPHKKDDADHKRHCPEKKKDEKKSEDTSSKKSTSSNDSDKVEAAYVPLSTSSGDTDQVAGVSTDESTPVGSADTGDGTFVPAPALTAASSDLGNDLALGGGVAAAALLGAYGVQMGRHRRVGAHRSR